MTFTWKIAAAALSFSVAVGVSAPAMAEAHGGEHQAEASAPRSVEDYLRPYYAQLAKTTQLPVANATPARDLAKPLTRIGFGSCNHHDRSQHMWPVIGAQNPELFLAIGDNVYGDNGWRGEADLGSFISAYAKQAAHPEFQALRSAVPMLATWDDHDFGPNDSGGAFSSREWSETIFETFWGASEAVTSRPGIYDSQIFGPKGQRVQIIMLDTRYFRSDLKSLPYADPRPPLGVYIADDSEGAQMLGEAQWQWLEAELAKPADLRLIISSIQVLTDAHGFEKWGNMPRERDRLYRLLKGRSKSGLVLLSGDRHTAGIYRDAPAALGEDVWEITSSSLNLAFVRDDASEREPDARRTTAMFSQENFGMIAIDWQAREVALRLQDAQAQLLAEQKVGF